MNNEVIANGFTLSPQQKLNWLENKRHHTCLFSIPEKWSKEGFLQALSTLFLKHEILRTRLEKVLGMEFPLQVIDAEINTQSIKDLSHLPFIKEQDIISFLKEDKTHKLEVKVQLFKLHNNKMYASFSLSSFVSDSYAMVHILNEIDAIYKKKMTEAPLQYADLSEWLNEILEEKNEYWNLKQIPKPIEADRFFSKEHNELLVSIPSDIKEQLLQMSSSKIKIFLFSCWQYLVQRHFDDDTNSFIASNGRSLPELQGVFGCLEKLMPFFTINPKRTINESISALENQWNERIEWEHDIPLEIARQRDKSVLFRFTDNTMSKSLKIVWQNISGEIQPLTLSVFQLIDDIQLQLVSTLSEKNNQYLLQQYYSVLTQALTSLDQRFDQIQIVSKKEKLELIKIGAGKPITISKKETLQSLFEQQVLKTPDAIAIESETAFIRYRDLDNKANSIAHFLEIYDDDFIGLHCDRSIEMIAGMLGILKAGKAYIPIDPNYPEGRINAILENSKLQLVLSQSEVRDLKVNKKITIKKISDITYNTTDFTSKTGQNKNAYVLYTSGSTGIPKGVYVGHNQVVNHMKWMAKEYPLDNRDNVLQRTPYGFDASVWEIFAPLLQGARLTLLPMSHQQNVHQILDYIKEKQITVFQVVPSLLNLLFQEADKTVLASVKTIFCGGEVLRAALVTKVLNNYDLALINLYGPTECTIQVSHHYCLKNEKNVPAGKPIDGVSFYILNSNLQLQPKGVKGELYIAGNCVSNGYLNQPELTKAAFIPDCIAKEKVGLMYRSGDIAFWNEAGELEIEGRIDDQIKLRGYRIELNEIEQVVMEHENISKAVSLVLKEEELKIIVCFYSTVNSQPIAQENLLKLVKNKLAEYMLPTHFIFLDEIPFTYNGKVDKKALKMMDLSAILKNRRLVAPRSQVEEQLMIIWKELLKQNELCVTDNFFNMGGHSLLAVNMATSIVKKIEVDFPLSAVFDYPTIELQAKFISVEENNNSCVVSLNKGNDAITPLFLCAPTGGLSGSYFKLSQLLENRSVYGLQDPGLNKNGIFYEDMDGLTDIFAKEIMNTQSNGSVCIGGWSFGGIVAVETAKKLIKYGIVVEKVFVFDSYAPIQKTAEPEVSKLHLSVARLLADLSGDKLTKEQINSIHDGTTDEVLTILLQLAVKGNLLPKTAANKDMLMLLNVFKMNVTILNNHICTPHSFELHLFEPLEKVPSYLQEAAFERKGERAAQNWRGLGALIVHKTAGHHLNMLTEPNVMSLSTKLLKILK